MLNIYYLDPNGIIYIVNNQSPFLYAEAFPSPILPGSTFQLGCFTYYLSQFYQLYSLTDSAQTPFKPKTTYSDICAVIASLTPSDPTEPATSELPHSSATLPHSEHGVLHTSIIDSSVQINLDVRLLSDLASPATTLISGSGTPKSRSENSSSPDLSSSSSSEDLPNYPLTPPATTTAPTSSSNRRALSFRSQEDVDKWVESIVSERKSRGASHARPKLNCRYCGKLCRRPLELKEHTYAHLHIKPHKCTYSGCTADFSTAQNRHRHVMTCSFSKTT